MKTGRKKMPGLDWRLRLLRDLLALLFLVGMYIISLNRPETKWEVMTSAPQVSHTDLSAFGTGDIVLYFSQGHDFLLFPGHMGIVVELPRYGQKFIWDLPLPWQHRPDVLKPLGLYLQRAVRKRTSRVYVQHVSGPVNASRVLSCIKRLSSSMSYRLHTFYQHLTFCSEAILGLPGLPDFLPAVPDQGRLYYCTSATLTVLVETGVLDDTILSDHQETVLHPQLFLQENWDLNRYARPGFQFGELSEVIDLDRQ